MAMRVLLRHALSPSTRTLVAAAQRRTLSTGAATFDFMSIQPTFSIKDWAKATPIMERFVAVTDSEKGCLYYGWTKTADKLFCREAYVDAAGVLEHLGNVGPLVGELLADPEVATLDEIQLHGPAAEVAKCKEGMDPLGTVYFEVHSGFQKFVR